MTLNITESEDTSLYYYTRCSIFWFQTFYQKMPRLFGEGIARRVSDASQRQHIPPAMFRLRGVRHPSSEGGSLRHKARTVVLQNRLRERSGDDARLRLR